MSKNAGTIDRQSVTPYYQQLVELLEERIARGDLAAGSRLPSENDLCTEFGLSRATVRQALQLLERRGAAHRIPGRGVFVSEGNEAEKGWIIQAREGFLENAIRNGNRDVSTRVLRYGPITLSAVTARLLDVEEGDEGYELVRVRSIDGTPALFSVNRLSAALVPIIAAAGEVLDGSGSLMDAIERAGYSLGGAQRTIRTDSASGEIASALGIRDGSPLLHIRSTSWTPEGERFDVYETWVRSEIIPLEINVGVVPLPAGI